MPISSYLHKKKSFFLTPFAIPHSIQSHVLCAKNFFYFIPNLKGK